MELVDRLFRVGSERERERETESHPHGNLN